MLTQSFVLMVKYKLIMKIVKIKSIKEIIAKEVTNTTRG